MRDTYTALYTHLIWGTWDRAPIVRPDREEAIYACIKNECAAMKVHVIAIGGTEDHVHLLVDVPPTILVCDLAKQVKAVSSLMVNSQFGPRGVFKWQGAYAAFSVSRHDVDRLTDYIQRQKHHHATKSVRADYEWDIDLRAGNPANEFTAIESNSRPSSTRQSMSSPAPRPGQSPPFQSQ